MSVHPDPTSSAPDVPPGAVLLLGGTTEGRRLARLLVEAGVPFVSSLAGVVAAPRLPTGPVRTGGFGGAAGLAAYLQRAGIGAVVDATHPFAERMTAHAASACAATDVPLLRLQRPSWAAHPAAATWTWVDSVAEAARAAAGAGRIFATTGRQALAEFAAVPGLAQRYVVARMVEPPDIELPPGWEVLLRRGPFTLEDEVELLRSRRIDVLVTKDSGGEATEPKLDAALTCGVAVVVVRRPPTPPGVFEAPTPEAALDWAIAALR